MKKFDYCVIYSEEAGKAIDIPASEYKGEDSNTLLLAGFCNANAAYKYAQSVNNGRINFWEL